MVTTSHYLSNCLSYCLSLLTDKMWKLFSFSRKKECSTESVQHCTGIQLTTREKALIIFVVLHLLMLLANLFFFLRPEPEKKIEEKSGWFWRPAFMYEHLKPSNTDIFLLYNMIFFAISLFFTIFGYFCQIFFSALYFLCTLVIDLVYYTATNLWYYQARKKEIKDRNEDFKKSRWWWQRSFPPTNWFSALLRNPG